VVVLARERGHGVTPPPRYAPVIPMMPVYLEYTPGSGRREGLYNVAGPGGLPCPGQAFLLFPFAQNSFLFYSFCRPNRSLRTRKGVVFRSILKEKGKKGTLIALLCRLLVRLVLVSNTKFARCFEERPVSVLSVQHSAAAHMTS
jgi:hypothetical protein